MRLVPIDVCDLPGWSPTEAAAFWRPFRASCEGVVRGLPALRRGKQPDHALVETCRRALAQDDDPEAIESFLESSFQACVVEPSDTMRDGFVTGYYEPVVRGSLTKTHEFTAPVLSRPVDLIDLRGVQPRGWPSDIEGACEVEGVLQPYPDRAAIEAGAIAGRAQPIVWLEDHVELFFAQVQGSARVVLPDGAHLRLVYAGRNGRPYASIGKALIAAGRIRADEMSLTRCKAWLRENGQNIGDPGRSVMQGNPSYVFFRLEPVVDVGAGPIGAQGLPLSPLRSIAVDRTVWPYGLPVWIEADLSSAGLGRGLTGRLMVAQDTGSAIVGPARADLFIGTGPEAGDIAGLIRHSARFVIFLPKEA
jgi:membrane-bound lytic murein transglycosylase A